MTQYLTLTQQSECNNSSSRQPYQKIGNDIREKVIYEIVFQEQSIKQTAIKYGLKYSTANGIVQTYQQQGRSSKKDKRNKKQYYKRNKLLVFINVITGDVELFRQQANSSVLILEQSLDVQTTTNFNKQEQFQNQKECTGQFVYSDLETISQQIFQILRKKENSIDDVNNILNIKQSVSSNTFEIYKTEELFTPQQLIQEQKKQNKEKEKQESNQFNGKKENNEINNINNIIKIECQDQFAIQFQSKIKNNYNNNLDNNYEKNYQKLLQLWIQQIDQMEKI